MTCHYCGADLSEDRRFCPCCGTQTKAESARSISVEEEFPVWEPVPPPAIFAEEYRSLAEPKETRFESPAAAPALKLPVKRGLAKMVFLGLLTLGIYPTAIWSRMVTELNIAASRADGRRTMPYFAMLVLAPVTLGIYPLVWMHKFCGRIGMELERRDLDYRFGARDFWLWNILGTLILVGPFVFVHRLTSAMNRINSDFNELG